MTSLTPEQVMLATAVVVGAATACQVVAPKLRIPALVLLLPVGFVLGAMAPDYRATNVLGPVFPALVDLVVAIILFQGGLDLRSSPINRDDQSLVRRLVWGGGAITLLGATVAAHFIVGIPWPIAFMLGAIVIVSGPTVVTPILDFAQVRGRVRNILQWEGTLLDPIGALVAVVVFQIVKASGAESVGAAVGLFIASLLVGVLAAFLGVVLLVIGGRLARGNDLMGTQVLIGSVIVAAGFADFISDDTGLLAALLMGMVAPRIASRFGASLDNSRPFFGTIVSIGIGVLFISIAGLVTLDSLEAILIPVLLMSVVLIVLVRPLVVAICTARTNLTARQRMFMAAMDPRGIVAAATASSVGAALVGLKVPGAEQLLPASFVIVAVTVAFYGLSAIPVAKALGIVETDSQSPERTTAN